MATAAENGGTLGPESVRSIRRTLIRRLALAGGALAAILGSLALAVEIERTDRVVVDLTVAEARRFLAGDRLDAREPERVAAALSEFLAGRHDGADGRFVEIEIYGADGGKIAESAVGDSAWQGRSAALTHALPDSQYWYRKHLIGWTLYVQAVVPFAGPAGSGYFEGVFEVSKARAAEMLRASLIAVLGVALAALATTGALYPLIARMNRSLARHAEGLEAALREARDANAATRAKSRFLATMSHELRTPLHGVVGALELLAGTQGLAPPAARLVSVAQGASAQLLSVIGDVLDYSKIEADRLELDPVEFDPRDVLVALAESFRAAATAKSLAFDVRVGEGVPERAVGDAARLRQIVANLVSNAIKFTERGSVRVEFDAPDSPDPARVRLRIRITDTGIGMTREQAGRVFQPFAQADAGTAARFGGTGLGLSISRRLAELMGGHIGLRSEPGSGSAFVVEVPLARPDNPVRRTAEDGAASRLAPFRALVADDNPVNREIVAGQLARLGAGADLVADGRAAVERFDAARHDIVLLDGQMPEMDGPQAAQALRRAEAGTGRRVPILALTASADPAEIARCRAAGMDDVLVKPVTLDRLGAALRAALAGNARPALDLAYLAGALGDLDADWVGATMRGFAPALAAQLDAIEAARAGGDAERARKEAHSARGAAASAGAGELAEALEALEAEAAASPERLDACRRALARARAAVEERWGDGK